MHTNKGYIKYRVNEVRFLNFTLVYLNKIQALIKEQILSPSYTMDYMNQLINN